MDWDQKQILTFQVQSSKFKAKSLRFKVKYPFPVFQHSNIPSFQN